MNHSVFLFSIRYRPNVDCATERLETNPIKHHKIVVIALGNLKYFPAHILVDCVPGSNPIRSPKIIAPFVSNLKKSAMLLRFLTTDIRMDIISPLLPGSLNSCPESLGQMES
jgi:hypothetical protein